mmetsp:Transcript_63116/g.169248  ORF Transcript_63116/g.169248 Transcript_63116/m.169248 type:complete len:294 (-) Transcript_63116:59-940(-)
MYRPLQRVPLVLNRRAPPGGEHARGNSDANNHQHVAGCTRAGARQRCPAGNGGNIHREPQVKQHSTNPGGCWQLPVLQLQVRLPLEMPELHSQYAASHSPRPSNSAHRPRSRRQQRRSNNLTPQYRTQHMRRPRCLRPRRVYPRHQHRGAADDQHQSQDVGAGQIDRHASEEHEGNGDHLRVHAQAAVTEPGGKMGHQLDQADRRGQGAERSGQHHSIRLLPLCNPCRIAESSKAGPHASNASRHQRETLLQVRCRLGGLKRSHPPLLHDPQRKCHYNTGNNRIERIPPGIVH